MANIKSQIKRNRQNEKRRVRNSEVRSSIRTSIKKVISAASSKEKKEMSEIKELYKKFVKKIDTAAGKGIIYKKTAARKKSRLAKIVNSALQGIESS